MKLMSQEYYDTMCSFEKAFRGNRLDKEAKELWPKGVVYQDGHVNILFDAYLKGYALHECVSIMSEKGT